MKASIIISLIILSLPIIGLQKKYSQDSIITSNTIAFLQFNTVREPANIGIQRRNISLNTFSNLPNNSFTEIHNNIYADGYINKKENIGVGIYYTLDNWSNRLYKNTLGIALKKKINNFHIGLGIERNSLFNDSTNITYEDMIDPTKGFIFPTNDFNSGYQSINLNFKPSVIYSNNRLKIGVTINHLSEPNLGLITGRSPSYRELLVNTSYLFDINQKWSYTPLINFFSTKIAQLLEIHNIITYSGLRKVHFLNLIYTNQKSLSTLYGINFNDRFKIYGRINIPIYQIDYFPLSAQAGVQYSFKTKKQ